MRWVNRQIRPGNRVSLGAAPVVISIIFYSLMAASRHAANPSDKISPSPGGMVEAMSGSSSEPDALSGQIVFWADTSASSQRLGSGLAISTVSASLVGSVSGVLPPVRV
ncbi:hypothetical protein OY671_011044, partial [Metschnikowia pulcherrima]